MGGTIGGEGWGRIPSHFPPPPKPVFAPSPVTPSFRTGLKIGLGGEDRKEEDESIELDEKAEGELCLTATVLGCRNNKDRIEFA